MSSAAARPPRLTAVDALRGLVMVIMVLDHAGAAFDAGHLQTDSVALSRAGMALPLDHLLARVVTHLCAPTFVFLAGTAIALSLARRRARPDPPRVGAVDRHLLLRGALIASLDVVVMSFVWQLLGAPRVVLQVLYAIGLALICMVPLRRLPDAVLVGAALAWLVFGEALTMSLWSGAFVPARWPVALLLAPGWLPLDAAGTQAVVVIYPLLPWLAIMMLGQVFGRRLAARPPGAPPPVRGLLLAGLVGLAVFAVVRGANGYGNMGLLREDGSLAQWLHVSKYPPSLSFCALTLGVTALLLAGFFVVQQRLGDRWSARDPLLVFGQTALFFYLVHVPLLVGLAELTGLRQAAGLPATFLASLVALVLLYPVCRRYRRYKRAHPDGWTRFL